MRQSAAALQTIDEHSALSVANVEKLMDEMGAMRERSVLS
jgi:hypothetical protein